jgi:hypothetical protein
MGKLQDPRQVTSFPILSIKWKCLELLSRPHHRTFVSSWGHEGWESTLSHRTSFFCPASILVRLWEFWLLKVMVEKTGPSSKPLMPGFLGLLERNSGFRLSGRVHMCLRNAEAPFLKYRNKCTCAEALEASRQRCGGGDGSCSKQKMHLSFPAFSKESFISGLLKISHFCHPAS